MTPAIESRLAHLARLQTEAGYAIRPPAAPDAIQAMAGVIETEFGLTLPITLHQVWSRHDGLWWDDGKLWRVVPAPGEPWPEDILSQSRAGRTDLGIDQVTLGGSSLDRYGYDCAAGRWTVTDMTGQDTIESWQPEEFDAFLARVLDLIANDPAPQELEAAARFYGAAPQ